MKALVLHKAGDCRYEKNWPEPKPKKGLVLVKVKYSGICGSDLPRMMMTGAYRHPIICGHEFMGETKKGDIVAVLPLIPCFKCSACNEQQYFHCKSYDFWVHV